MRMVFFFFQFDKAGAYRQVVESGPWHFAGKLMVLQQWQPQMNLVKKQLDKIPVWAHFYNVPLELWTEQGLSHVASAVGRPLYADHLTESCKRISFAKICVEVDANADLPESFDLSLPSGASFTIRVWYPWRPLKCDSCKVFGHKSCQKQAVPTAPGNQVWVAKFSVPAAVENTTVSNGVGSTADIMTSVGLIVEERVGISTMQSPPGCIDLKNKSVTVGLEQAASTDVSTHRLLGPIQGSPSGIPVEENRFSALQNVGDAQVEAINSCGTADPVILPTDDEFVAGMSQNLIAKVSPRNKRGRGRNKGVKNKAEIPAVIASNCPGKGRGVKVLPT